MLPIKTQSNGRFVDMIQWTGLAMLVAFTYRHFGPSAHTPITLPVIGVFAASVVLLLRPVPIKLK